MKYHPNAGATSHLILVILWGLLFGQHTSALDIWLPRQHIPAFVQPGGSFIAEVKGASNLPTAGWHASITNDLRSWSCGVTPLSYGSIHQGLKNGWRVAVAVPVDAPPELFKLVLANTLDGSATQNRAVRVVRDFEESFYILQLSDQHVTNERAVVPGGNASAKWGNGSTDAMRWAAPVLNLINPRFVLFTGDNNQIYNSATSWCEMTEARRRIQIYLNALQEYSVASVIVNGNHDVGYSSYIDSRAVRDNYEAMIGQRVFSFRMGSFYVLGNEFTYNEFFPWVKSDYAAAGADASVKYRLIAQHYPDHFVTVAYAINPCNLMLVGHSHKTQTYQTTPYPIQVSGTSQDHQKASFYSFDRNANGWTCPQATNHLEGVSVWPLVGDWGSNPVVSAVFSRINNGTQISNTVGVANTLPQDFRNGRVRFLMAHAPYSVTGGEIEAQYDYGNGSSTAVLVKANLRKKALTTVTIARASPRFGASAVSADNLILSGAGGAPVGQYLVLTSSNAALPVADWTRMATNSFDAGGNFAFTNSPRLGSPGQFFRLLIP